MSQDLDDNDMYVPIAITGSGNASYFRDLSFNKIEVLASPAFQGLSLLVSLFVFSQVTFIHQSDLVPINHLL